MKKRIKIKRLGVIILVLILVIISYFLVTMKIGHIIIKGNFFLTDQEIIETAEIEQYPSFLLTFGFKLKNKLKTNPLIDEVKIKKKFFNTLEIEVKEKEILLYDKTKEEYILSDETRIKKSNYNDVAILINYVIKEVFSNFINRYNRLDRNVRNRISEVKYDPSEYDNARFLFLMNDGNYVYINIPNLDRIKYYDKIVETLNNKKGILYLDSGYGTASQFVIFD